MSSVMFTANVRINNKNSYKITIPKDLVQMIHETSPNLRFLQSVRIENDRLGFALPYVVMAKGSGQSHYILLNSDNISKYSIELDEKVNVVVDW